MIAWITYANVFYNLSGTILIIYIFSKQNLQHLIILDYSNQMENHFSTSSNLVKIYQFRKQLHSRYIRKKFPKGYCKSGKKTIYFNMDSFSCWVFYIHDFTVFLFKISIQEQSNLKFNEDFIV